MAKTVEEHRKKPCYGELRCWNHIQVLCPVYYECFAIAGGQRKCDRIRRSEATSIVGVVKWEAS